MTSGTHRGVTTTQTHKTSRRSRRWTVPKEPSAAMRIRSFVLLGAFMTVGLALLYWVASLAEKYL